MNDDHDALVSIPIESQSQNGLLYTNRQTDNTKYDAVLFLGLLYTTYDASTNYSAL